ncbi:hypothetical protein, partial [Frankia nepalensis]|uniref:hypothetical protein n=1 Tax=Frankia nepalensis TaxID=1836974 RepID=UPI001EE40E97
MTRRGDEEGQYLADRQPGPPAAARRQQRVRDLGRDDGRRRELADRAPTDRAPADQGAGRRARG